MMPQPVGLQFGIPQFKITLELDEKGLLRCKLSRPLPYMQIIGLLIDALQGQYRMAVEQASMIIDPNKPKTIKDGLKPNANGEEKKDDYGSGGIAAES